MIVNTLMIPILYVADKQIPSVQTKFDKGEVEAMQYAGIFLLILRKGKRRLSLLMYGKRKISS